jgi:hypothetical protein
MPDSRAIVNVDFWLYRNMEGALGSVFSGGLRSGMRKTDRFRSLTNGELLVSWFARDAAPRGHFVTSVTCRASRTYLRFDHEL